eukprot:NODE_113_length_18482_cov_1.630746.p12 type:complete len:218 gc:universal NODE_113_length_18482_cov_1.630746:16328-16981(+)
MRFSNKIFPLIPMEELSAEARAALCEFLAEEQQYIDQFEQLKSNSEKLFTMKVFKENWQLSQFWYDDKTASTLANEAIRLVGIIGFVSSPTAYVKYKSLTSKPAVLFEFDERFACYDEFVHFDYNDPYNVDLKLHNHFDVLVVDPPFLSEECLLKTWKFVKILGSLECKVILCTGKTMEKHLLKLGFQETKFKPMHEKERLSNDFGCFINYESENLK